MCRKLNSPLSDNQIPLQMLSGAILIIYRKMFNKYAH